MARRNRRQATSRSPVHLLMDDPKSGFAEAYRILRTNLQYYNVGEPLRKLLLTSTAQGEGKSTTAANLAVSMAQTGQRVILVDADLRRPLLHRVFRVSNIKGLTNALTGAAPLEEVIVDSGFPNLRLLPAGPQPPNPSEMLASSRMEEIVEKLAETADVVVIDSPPVMAVADASVMARLVDGVIMVIGVGLVSREMAQRAKAQLDAVRARVLGTVINGAENKGLGYYYGHHQGEER